MIGVNWDITGRKRADENVQRLAAIVESSADAIISKSLNGIITSWNAAAEIMFGYTAAEIIGQPLLVLLPPDRTNEEVEILADFANGELVKHFETVRLRKGGQSFDVFITISPIKDAAGKIIGASKIVRDITELKKLEQQFRQVQKMESFGQLAGGVAHDFNNILACIQMQADLFKDDSRLSPEQLDCANEIGVATERAAALTRQLLLFSRKEILQLRDLDLNRSITGMTNMLRRILGEDILAQFKFSLQPLGIHADPGMMDQVLMNLAVNSRDAMPNGGQLIIETSAVNFDQIASTQSAQARPGAFVCLSVSDNGCGIAPENLSRIFEPFFTTKEVGKGTGLGLATLFGIVQQHKGWVNVDSELGRGTTFRIYLPRLAKLSVAAQKPEQPKLNTLPGGTETILLVEDDDFLRPSVCNTLSRLGYHVIPVSNGIKAVEIWQVRHDEIQMLITDLVMPGGMSGKNLGELLLKQNPKLKVIYASGYSAEIVGTDFPLKEGLNFLTKPFQAEKLALAIRKSLDTPNLKT
jgi:PAS domain S-box-containing protein